MARIENQPQTVCARPSQTVTARASISQFAIDHPWSTVVLWSVLSIAGILAFTHLKLALFPDISSPVVVVTARSAILDPSANERGVTGPLERALLDVPGETTIHSLTYPQFVEIDMQFDVTEPIASRHDEVAKAVGAVKLPAGVTTSVSALDLNVVPVVTYALVGNGRPLRDLGRFANDVVVPPLLQTAGVLRADVLGAQITGSHASAYRYDGKPAIAISVVKRADANTLEVADGSSLAIARVRAAHPEIGIEVTSNQAPYIREATQATQEALALAIVLAVIVIWPFLRDLRATLISAIAIPVSLLGTACVMWLCRFNLETITLLALALVVGVIVDDAIVAVENIVRHLEAGETPRDAALDANKEIGLTLVAATFTIVAVFLPIGLMNGSLGRFFRAFGITASAAVLLSLLAARTLSPALAAWWLRAKREGRVDADRTSLHPWYRTLIAWALAHKRAVIGLAAFAFAAGLALIPFIPKGFVPHLDRGEYIVNFRTPLGTSLGDTEATAATLEDAIRKDPSVSDIYTTIGAQANASNVGTMDVKLARSRNEKTIDAETGARARIPALDGVVTTVGDVPFVGTDTTKPLQFALVSDDIEALRSAGRAFEHKLQHHPGFVDVSASGISDGTPFSAIEHVGGKRAVQITADLAANLQIGDANGVVSSLARTLPKNVTLSFVGNSQTAVTTFTDFGIALGLSVVAILVVLVLLFRTWVDPLAIIVSLPLSIVGALFALWVTRADFGLISLMAVIFLFGLVNKNAILLVDRIEKLRTLGMRRTEAIGEAGAQRLRPIVMTTSATILGMLPIALGFGAGAELRAPMAVAIIGGLITSTVLSLIVVPVAYAVFDDIAHRGRAA
jgi:multidrug efflux pump subunit AcrB